MSLAIIIIFVLLIQPSHHQCPDKCLCSGVSNTTTLRCIWAGLKVIPTLAPIDAPFLITLDLRFNQIRQIPPGSFKNLEQLNTLLLNNNHLKRLRSGVFKGLQHLEYLYLYKNRIHSIDNQVFDTLSNLKHLYIHYNYIKVISPPLFQNLPKLERLFLHHNKISSLPTNSLANTTSITRLRLDGNPLHCDCHFNWFFQWSQLALNSTIRVSGSCITPSSIANTTLSSIISQNSSTKICDKSYFTEEPTDTDVVPGGTIVFRCQARGANGQPLGNLRWTQDGKAIESTKVLRDGTLIIPSASPVHVVGWYQCHAGGGDTGQAAIVSRRARVRFYRGRAKPVILQSPVETEVEKGSTIRLECLASGFPRPLFAWYKDGGRLSTAHSRYKIEENGTLVITNAQLGDSGHYRCSASNYLGRASSAARVKVNLNIPEAAPRITSFPRDASINEGLFVEFTCVASGHPYPDVSWWNNNRLVEFDGGRIQVSNGGQHLRIEDGKAYDSGLYTCRAQNRLGYIEASAKLEVKSSSTASVPLELITVPHDMVAPPGTTVQLPCRAEGFPRPEIQWLKDGHVMSSERRRFDIRPDGSLVVQNVTQEDEGMYECVADNGHERKSAQARFSVRSAREISNAFTYTSVNDADPGSTIGDQFVLVALEEALVDVDKALNSTLDHLFSASNRGGNATSSSRELLRIFRYPPENQRGVARAAEVFERTLDLVAEKVKSIDDHSSRSFSNFTYQDLVSPYNLELIGNLSGCQAHRSQQEVNCTRDLCFHSQYRSVDGTCNNFQNPLLGASMTAFKRLLPARYEDGFHSPVGWDPNKLYNGYRLPSARAVSSALISTDTITEDTEISHMVMQWGQFLDHDMDHAMEAISRETFANGITCSATCQNQLPCFPIQIPSGDQRLSNRSCLEFTRSSAACGSGHTSAFFDRLQPRQQLNQPTSFIDASQVYGSSLDLAISLRNLTNDLGRLREGLTFNYGPRPFLPFNTRHLIDCRRDPRESNIGCFLAGDQRANEQLGLTAMHTLWFREHNRLASQLKQLNPHWEGDRLYEESRKIVGAQMQYITYQHWLPLIIGTDLPGGYQGYKAQVDPSAANVFASSAFRFGHTLVNPVLRRLNASLLPIAEGDLPLHQAFFAPWRIVQEGGIDPILRGLFASPAKKNVPNQVMNEELTERLFGAVHAVALDLSALNIQRGRDHGLPSYTAWRTHCGLSPVKNWSDLERIVQSTSLSSQLRRLYGHPDNIDLWVGGLLEPPLNNARVGETVRCLLVDQFKRSRDGDRFWYENPATFQPWQLDQIKQTSLARVLCDNGDQMERVFRNVFKHQSQHVDCKDLPQMSLLPWFESTTCPVKEASAVPSLVRSRRDIASDNAEDPTGERIEGLEVVIMKNKLEMLRMKRQIQRVAATRLHSKPTPSPLDVCIDHSGTIREESEHWFHHDSKNDKCAGCICQAHQIKCQKVQCTN